MSQPKRILQIVTQMNRGGLETMIMNYYRNVDRSKIQFDFLTHRSDKKDYDDEIESLGGKIYHLPRLNPFSPSYRKALKTFFNEHPEYQVVHCHLDCMSSLPLYYAKKAGVKYRIAHSHNTSQEKNLKYVLKMLYKRRIPKYATNLYSCGLEAGNWMFDGKPFYVLNNAIDSTLFQYNEETALKMKRELHIEDCYVLGHIGRFNEQKNHEYLIDIFNKLQRIDDKSRLLLIGEGILEEKIKNKVFDLGLNGKVLFLGLRTDIPELLQAIDVFVFPSLFEGLPVTMVEAQAAGLPCVISNTISDETILTKNVTTVALENTDEWVKEIEKYRKFKRVNNHNEFIQSGFDIKENAKALQRIYLEME